MAFLASAVLPYAVALLVAVASAFLWREQLPRPFIYCTVSFFLVLGLHRTVQSVVELARSLWPLGGGYFVVVKPTSPEAIEALERQMTIEGLAIAVAASLLSYPLLLIVKGGIGK